MYKVSPLVLTAALFGLEAASVSAADCYALYTGSGSYQAGDVVSADVTEQETVDKQCSPGSTGCSCDADDSPGTNCKKSVTQDVQVRYNFECTSGANAVFCGQSGYAPGTLYSGQAWTKDGTECTVTATPATVAPPAEWSEGGCPEAYELGTAYAPNAAVSVATNNGYSVVYKCTSDSASSAWCGMEGYQPGDSVYFGQVWTLEGSCDGTLSPSSAAAADVGDGYLGGCPGAWESRDGSDPYEEGDRISKDGVVYQCKAWPNNLHCGQDGYEPLAEDNGNPTAWQQAWTVKGTCSGTIVPTSAPSFDPENSVGACPDEWEAGNDHTKYQPGDMVSVTVSTSPLRQVAYKCKDDIHLSNFCAQYAPTEFGGDQGWEYAGSCDGSMGPTSSPTFDDLKPLIAGCPPEWVANTDYEAEDQVTVVVSDAPERKIVYECKKYPYTGYCLQFAPGSEYGYMGWELKSACEGTIAPTAAPVPYAGTCEFEMCREQDVTRSCNYNPFYDASCKKSTCTCSTSQVSCSSGSTGCSCDNSATPVCTKSVETCTACSNEVKENVCTVMDVENYTPASTSEVAAGDVVRIGAARFKAKGWPNYLWARQEAYQPTLEDTGLWTQAWTRDGDCDGTAIAVTASACAANANEVDCVAANCGWYAGGDVGAARCL